jgi:hypothetical protein
MELAYAHDDGIFHSGRISVLGGLNSGQAYIPTRRQKNALNATQTFFEPVLKESLEAFSPASLPG